MKGNSLSSIFTVVKRIQCPARSELPFTQGQPLKVIWSKQWIDNDFKSDQQIQLLKKQYQHSCLWFGSRLSCYTGGQCQFCGSQIKGKAQGRRNLQASGPSALEQAQIRLALSLQVYKSYSKTCLFSCVFTAYMRVLDDISISVSVLCLLC